MYMYEYLYSIHLMECLLLNLLNRIELEAGLASSAYHGPPIYQSECIRRNFARTRAYTLLSILGVDSPWEHYTRGGHAQPRSVSLCGR